MSRIILFNADDWGLSQQIHDSITELHQAGALDAAGIMMGQPFTAQAVSYAASNPGLLTGIHLFATDRDCTPLTMPRWGTFWPEDMLINTVAGLPSVRKIILAEVDAQFAAWKATGLPLHFVNSHFHFHAQHHLVYLIIELLLRHFPDFKGWIRLGDSRTMPGSILNAGGLLADLLEQGIFVRDWQGRSNDTLWGIDQTFANSAPTVAAACAKLGDGFHEFFFHPGRSWKLTDNGTDHAALLELATLLPPAAHNVKLLLPP
ncbi:MAG: ChbG/HpnK family deacetylase [Luteolibacter sp.]